MTLENTVLQRLAEWHAPPGRHDLAVSDPASGWSAAVTAERNDAVGTRVWELAVRRGAKEPALDLRAWAGRATARAVGLIEPLKLVELDEGRGEALLRSDGPSERGGGLFYYELRLKAAGEALLRRYRGSHEPGPLSEEVPAEHEREAHREGAEDGHHVQATPDAAYQVPETEPDEGTGEELRRYEVFAEDKEAGVLSAVLELVEG